MTVSKLSILSAEGGVMLSLLGTGLNDALLYYPASCNPVCAIKATGSTFAVLTLPKPTPPTTSPTKDAPAPFDPTKDVKQIVLCRKDVSKQPTACDAQYPPVVVDLPKADAPKDAKPALEKVTAAVGAGQVSISGTGLDQVIAVQYGRTYLGFRLVPDADKKIVLSLTLPRELFGLAGIYTLTVTIADKTTLPYALTIGTK
jgi:hypothetical protein